MGIGKFGNPNWLVWVRAVHLANEAGHEWEVAVVMRRHEVRIASAVASCQPVLQPGEATRRACDSRGTEFDAVLFEWFNVLDPSCGSTSRCDIAATLRTRPVRLIETKNVGDVTTLLKIRNDRVHEAVTVVTPKHGHKLHLWEGVVQRCRNVSIIVVP